MNVENPQMATVLIHNLQECMARGMESTTLVPLLPLSELSAMLGIGVHTGVHLTTNTGAEEWPFRRL